MRPLILSVICGVLLCLQVSSAQSLAEHKAPAITVYPNPAIADIIVETENMSGTKTIAIFSMLGQQVQSFTTAENALVIDVSGIAESQFFVVLRDAEGKTWTRRVSKL